MVPKRWFYLLVGLFMGTSMVVFWLIQEYNHKIQLGHLMGTTESVAENIRLRLEGNKDYLMLIAQERGDGIMDAQSFQERATQYVNDHPELVCINWVDKNFSITNVAPLEPNKQVLGLRLDLPEPKRAAHQAKATKLPVYTKPFDIIQGGFAFEVWVPVYNDQEFIGGIGGIYSYEKLIQALIPQQVRLNHNIQVVNHEKKILLGIPPNNSIDDHLEYQTALAPEENRVYLRFEGCGQSYLESAIFVLEFLCLVFVIGILYILWRLYREFKATKLAQEEVKKSLAQKEVLIQELYHRTKNSLNTIIAFVQLQKMYSSNTLFETILNDVISRIQSMALVHQMLYQTKDLSSIDLKEYIQNLVQVAFKTYNIVGDRIQIEYDLENVLTLIDTAIPCGLVINELITNSIKHAFPNEKAGHIFIALKRIKDHSIMLHIADDGVGLPKDVEIDKQRSLGLLCIANIAENQLQGTIEWELTHGFGVSITFSDNLYHERV